MAVAELAALVTPPSRPQDGAGSWRAIQPSLGIHYPADFRELIERYGTGEFFEKLVILNPLNQWCREDIAKQLKNLRAMRDAMDLSGAVHPETAGLFPWGFDSNGNKFCWLTKGEPDEWPVIQLGHNEEGDLHRADVSVTTFLVNFAKNKYPEMLGGVRFKKRDLRFVSGLPWEQG